MISDGSEAGEGGAGRGGGRPGLQGVVGTGSTYRNASQLVIYSCLDFSSDFFPGCRFALRVLFLVWLCVCARLLVRVFGGGRWGRGKGNLVRRFVGAVMYCAVDRKCRC